MLSTAPTRREKFEHRKSSIKHHNSTEHAFILQSMSSSKTLL